MKERPILFSGEMVRAILAGTKTVTRRIVRPQPVLVNKGRTWEWPHESTGLQEGERLTAATRRKRFSWWSWAKGLRHPMAAERWCPYGVPGDRLWVRETWNQEGGMTTYFADGDWIADYRNTSPIDFQNRKDRGLAPKWHPSIHMPRAASRLTLDVIAVRVERLQDITAADAAAEGVIDPTHGWDGNPTYPVARFRNLWDSINGKRATWASNHWVWVVSFKVAEG